MKGGDFFSSWFGFFFKFLILVPNGLKAIDLEQMLSSSSHLQRLYLRTRISKHCWPSPSLFAATSSKIRSPLVIAMSHLKTLLGHEWLLPIGSLCSNARREHLRNKLKAPCESHEQRIPRAKICRALVQSILWIFDRAKTPYDRRLPAFEASGAPCLLADRCS